MKAGQAGTYKRKREGKDLVVEDALDQWHSGVAKRGSSGPLLAQ